MKITEVESLYYEVEEKKNNTKSSYIKGLKEFKEWLLNNFQIEEIEGIKNMHLKLYKKHLSGLQLKGTTKNARLTAVMSLLKFAIINGLVSDKVTQAIKIDFDTSDSEETGFLSLEQVKTVLNSIRNSSAKGKRKFEEMKARDYALILMGASFGLRASEFCNLTYDMIVDNKLTIPKHLRKNGEKLELLLSEEVINALEIYNNNRSDDSNYVFVSSKGKQLKRQNVNDLVKKRVLEAGLEVDRIHTHSLRHTANILMINKGMNVSQRCQLLGQKSQMSNATYSKHMASAEVFDKISIFS